MLKVGIIGAGRLGTALALGIIKKGYEIGGIASKSDSSVENLNKKAGTDFKNCLFDVVKNSDLIAITVPDNEIENVATKISNEVGTKDIYHKTFLHFSGSVDSDALTTLRHKDGFTGTLHPIQTFTPANDSWKGLEAIYYGFEGSTDAEKYALELVDLFDGQIIKINKDQKSLYHAACCIISNYTVTLSYIAEQIFKEIGIEPEVSNKALRPLLENTVKNILLTGSEDALTGPISRGDTEVVKSHIDVLENVSKDDSKNASKDVCETYRNLAKITAQIALKKGTIDKEKYVELLEILK